RFRLLSADVASPTAVRTDRPKSPALRGALALRLAGIVRRCIWCNRQPSRVAPSPRSARRRPSSRRDDAAVASPVPLCAIDPAIPDEFEEHRRGVPAALVDIAVLSEASLLPLGRIDAPEPDVHV